jgi:hypothetical protein
MPMSFPPDNSSAVDIAQLLYPLYLRSLMNKDLLTLLATNWALIIATSGTTTEDEE